MIARSDTGRPDLKRVLAPFPVAALVACAWAQAWAGHGSILAGDWLGYAVAAALVLTIVLASGSGLRPGRAALLGFGGLAGLAVWDAISATWAPSASLARDEALLTLLYAVALILPALTLRTADDRLRATGIVVAGAGTLAIAVAVKQLVAAHPASLFIDGRLSFPISYANGLAALFLVCFWPAVAIAGRRSLNPPARGLACGAAAAFLCTFLATQSKGAAVGLVLSTIVVFALASIRVRLLVPVAIAAGCAAAGALPLTEPYRASVAATGHAVRVAGAATLAVVAAAALLGALAAVVDRRREVDGRTTRRVGAIVLAAVVLALVAGVAAFFVHEPYPGRFASARWAEFKSDKFASGGSTHFVAVGSNRYDFWRVALGELKRHPLQGDGARGFGPAYLQHGRSFETPRRAHSLPLEALGEVGIVGFLLLLLGVGAPLVATARAARRPSAVAALGASVYWLGHALVDWNWTFPAAGLPFFLLLGIGVASGGEPLRRRVSAGAAALAAAIAVLAFAPPWLSARFTTRALQNRATADSDLRWARRLDPLTIDPLVARYELTGDPSSLETALDREPRNFALHFLLGQIALSQGKKTEGRAQLLAAQALYPRSPVIGQALRRAR